jgi:ABC-type transport system involved in cytochrome c biogenesis permease subunit
MATLSEPRTAADRPPAAKPTDPLVLWLYGGIVVVGLGILYFTGLNFLPIFQASQVRESDQKVELPGYKAAAWHEVPVQADARLKPFETAARESLMRIHGRTRFQGQSAVAVVLDWMLEYDGDAKTDKVKSKWEDVPFILCEYQDLRRLIYQLGDDGRIDTGRELTHDELHGKYLAPAQLRAFRPRLMKLKEVNPERFDDLMRPKEALKTATDEALGRLSFYDSIRPARITSEDEKLHDPFAFVALDQVKGSPWFSLAELRQLNQFQLDDVVDGVKVPRVNEVWVQHMRERIKTVPQMYLSKEHRDALEEFQGEVKAGNGARAVGDLEPILNKHRSELVAKYRTLRAGKKQDREKADLIVMKIWRVLPKDRIKGEEVLPAALQQTLNNIVELRKAEDAGKDKTDELARELNLLVQHRDTRRLEELRSRLPKQGGYDPGDTAFRMLHLSYLEMRFPDIWEQAANWQKYPAEDVARILEAYKKLGAAYHSGDAEQFDTATTEFATAVDEVSARAGPYPGADGIGDRLGALLTGGTLHPPSRQLLDLERLYNRISPFTWSWVLMLAGLAVLSLALGLKSKWCYRGGLALYALSLGFQMFGFFVRIIISGRPPVSNIYETVIWVAFMSAVFALFLEMRYKNKVFVVGGALVAAIALVLADQMPLALDPKINPLQPVLRSNFWLTIHVLVIVSSYAGGTLAWGLGNIALLLILFGDRNRQTTIKMLSQFTYKALQIAVLLLAAGTFLGGWWAAYSWGRFWGWDPKETGALIALLCYVIPLHMRYVGWIKDFGLAVAAILCYAAILMSWYGVNFVFPAGLHAYGFGNGGAGWVYWASLINIEWVLVASLIYWRRQHQQMSAPVLAGAPAAQLSAAAASEHVKE